MRETLVALAVLLAGCSDGGGDGGGDEDEPVEPLPEDDTDQGLPPGVVVVTEDVVNETTDLEFTIIGVAEAYVEGDNCVRVLSSDVFSISEVQILAQWNSTGPNDEELSLLVVYEQADGGISGSSYATMSSPLTASHEGWSNIQPDDVAIYGLNTGAASVVQDLPVSLRLMFTYDGLEPVEFQTIQCSLIGER